MHETYKTKYHWCFYSGAQHIPHQKTMTVVITVVLVKDKMLKDPKMVVQKKKRAKNE